MNLTELWSHAVELERQGRQEAQSLPGWAVGDVLSTMPRCLPGSLRSWRLLPSLCTLLSPTWKIRTPMWECCLWIIVQHLTPCLPSSRLWDWTYLCAAGSWTSWQAEVRWSEWATTHHLLWSSTLVLRRAASSAHSCTPCTHTTLQPHTALTSSSN